MAVGQRVEARQTKQPIKEQRENCKPRNMNIINIIFCALTKKNRTNIFFKGLNIYLYVTRVKTDHQDEIYSMDN